MNPILGALSAGYTPQHILRYLSQHNPRLAQQINGALSAGHSVDNVLRFLERNQKKLGKLIPEERSSKSSNLYKTSQELHTSLLGGAKALGTTAAIAGSAYGLSRMLPAAVLRGQVLQALPQNSQIPHMGGPTINIGHQPLQIAPNPTTTNPSGGTAPSNPPTSHMQPHISPINNTNSNIANIQANNEQPNVNTSLSSSQQPPANQVAASIPEPVNIEQPKEKTNITEKLWNDLDKPTKKSFGFESDAFLKIARRMKSTGEIKSKEDFEKFFNIFDQKKNEGKNLPQALKEASNEFDQQKLGGESQSLPKSTKLVDKPSEFTIVASPEGFGEIKTSRNGKAIIEVEGKTTMNMIDKGILFFAISCYLLHLGSKSKFAVISSGFLILGFSLGCFIKAFTK